MPDVLSDPSEEPPGQPRVTMVRSTDAAEHAGLTRGWSLEFTQLSSGRFDGSLIDIRLDRMQILRDVANTALAKRGRAWDGSIVFSLPIEAQGEGRFAGRPLIFPACLVTDGQDLVELCTPRSLDLACIAVNRSWLLEMAETQGRKLAAQRLRGGRPGLHGSTPTMRRLKQAVADVFADLPRLTRALDHDGGRAGLESTLADLLLDTLSAEEEGDRLSIATPQKRIADKARAFVMEHAERQPTIDDICRHVGVSRRKLQNCFHDAFGFSPTQFLRMMRLDGVRRDLRAAAGGPVSIGEIASRWGFWHWSRFAGEYRALFGELPSETLRRPRG
ncbi:helix-turn-helix domain-containing protein [Azospirillum sp. TSH100]|uniref:helix-turn-helix domain-containing protein n=2 Tax=Azospirillum sp. TSH100 TaxID=652764 RepID=UPI001FFF5456|nr:helix-turn-helix domain-containing protein [Azospirillum sp. TSH100]